MRTTHEKDDGKTMMRILVLDDDAERHDAFDEALSSENSVEHAWSYHDAIAMLESEQFDVAYLDHDLSDFEDASSTIVGAYGNIELTGADVARFIAHELPRGMWPKRVVVHSWNPDGAKRMIAMLREAGIPCVYEPFQQPAWASDIEDST